MNRKAEEAHLNVVARLELASKRRPRRTVWERVNCHLQTLVAMLVLFGSLAYFAFGVLRVWMSG